MSDDLLNMRRLVSGALYHDRFSAPEAQHLLTVIFQAVGSDAMGKAKSRGDAEDVMRKVRSIGDDILDMASTAEQYAVDALLCALVRCKTDMEAAPYTARLPPA
jgi:hypothetical protein